MGYELTISQAGPGDLEIILSLQKECYLSEAELYNDFNMQPLTQTIESVKDEYQKGTLFLKGMIDDKIVASVRAAIKDDTVHIGKLIVNTAFQGNGIGQRMMNAIEKEFNNCKQYELFTGHKSERNIYLYKKLGYNEFKRKTINENLTLIFMKKSFM